MTPRTATIVHLFLLLGRYEKFCHQVRARQFAIRTKNPAGWRIAISIWLIPGRSGAKRPKASFTPLQSASPRLTSAAATFRETH